ncbi:hypothetical protein GUJ93_ZPchr0008g12874 [Zizania palustris]|uniref:Uncharacterized protein n=1 Tax=Zizania palustris TaxID=103762 RepID=A0A8J5RHU9_ZIZPA|nr:hypothetical protein GUJ93_ZPchr0008g12874 [Zizania palustris]
MACSSQERPETVNAEVLKSLPDCSQRRESSMAKGCAGNHTTHAANNLTELDGLMSRELCHINSLPARALWSNSVE